MRWEETQGLDGGGYRDEMEKKHRVQMEGVKGMRWEETQGLDGGGYRNEMGRNIGFRWRGLKG